MSRSPLEILYEDNHLLAVAKPAGLPTMGVRSGRPSLVQQAKAYLKDRYRKPGNVYLGVVSRLDAVATGVVLLARTSKAARRLTDQFRSHAVEKHYLLIVDGLLRPASGQWIDWIAPDPSRPRMRTVEAHTPGGKQASLAYRRTRVVRGPLGTRSVASVLLRTGRKHQIRVQFAARGHPVVGDRKYGSRTPFPEGIALHAHRLILAHPVRDERLELVAPPPLSWKGLET